MHHYYLDTVSRVADLPLFRATNPATARAAAAAADVDVDAKTFRGEHNWLILKALVAVTASTGNHT